MYRSWLKYRTTFEEIEEKYDTKNDKDWLHKITHDKEYAKFISSRSSMWIEFKKQYQPGDLIYYFEYKYPLADRMGYCLIRDGKMVRWYLTVLS